MKITIEADIKAPLEKVWAAYNTPEDIKAWNAASDDWHCPSASVDLRVGGILKNRMEARDGSMGFDLEATYTAVQPHSLLEFKLADERMVRVEFTQLGEKVHVVTSFDAENTFPHEHQRQGWQAILNRFAEYVQAHHST